MQKQSFFNLLGQNGRRMTKVYSCICPRGKPHTFDFSASISSLYCSTQRASLDRVLFYRRERRERQHGKMNLRLEKCATINRQASVELFLF